MIRRPVAHALLVALALGVMTAAYPCSAVAAHTAPAARIAKLPCHGAVAHQHSPVPYQARHRGCCDPTQSHPEICQKACQAVAVLGPAAALPVPEGRTVAVSPSAERPLSMFIAAIDHIPLT
jgi:hypothetical protein